MDADDDDGVQGAWSPGLRAVAAHLWSPSDNIVVTTRRDPYPEYREIDSYLIVPSAARAKFLVPLSAGRATAAATLLAYNRLRPKSVRAVRGVVAAGVRGGLLPVRAADRLRVLAPRDSPNDELIYASPRHWLANQLGADQLVMALAVPAITPNSKPTLQLFTGRGAPVAYAKLSWNASTSLQAQNEARMSSQLGRAVGELRVPRVLLETVWRGFNVVVTEAMPTDVVAWGMNAPPPPLSLTRDILRAAPSFMCQLEDSPLVGLLEERAAGSTDAADERLCQSLRHALTAVKKRWGGHPLRHGAWHGDWVPWNMARHGAEVIAWDWEHSREGVPAGFDLLHWHFQLSFIHHRKPLPEALRDMSQDARPSLAELQASVSAVEPCAALYLLELSARYLSMYRAGAGWNPRFYPAILSALEILRV